jgi:uncharacterized integral membrane protein
MQIKKTIILIIMVLLLIILFQNLSEVPINILIWTIYVSFLVIMLMLFVIGVVVGWLLKSSWIKRKKNSREEL